MSNKGSKVREVLGTLLFSVMVTAIFLGVVIAANVAWDAGLYVLSVLCSVAVSVALLGAFVAFAVGCLCDISQHI